MARTTIPAELVAINAIQGTLIADNAITAVHIATNAVSGTLVADNAITSTHIAQNNVTATQIANNTITVTQLADNAVETDKINNDAVTQAKIADDAIGPDQLAANAVVSASIANGTIVAADLADNAVTLAKMASLARGKIIYGDSAGDPAALAVGSNGQVLKSDGTDIAWASDSGLTSGDIIPAAAGSVSAPSLSFAGDPNTGLYSVAADNIGFAIGGVDKGFWSATQLNVTGIVDGDNFKINGAQGSDGQVMTSTGSGVAWEDAAGGSADGITASGSYTILQSPDDTSVVAVGNNANVGIGTLTPGQKLTVEANTPQVEIRNTHNTYHYISFVNSSATTSYNDMVAVGAEIDSGSAKGRLVIKTRASDGSGSQYERMRINNTGGVTFTSKHQGDTIGNVMITSQVGDSPNTSENCQLSVKNGGQMLQIMAWAGLGARIGTRTSGWNSNSGGNCYMTGQDTTCLVLKSDGVAYLANGSTAVTSDERLKKNITNMADGQLAKINALKVRHFEWKDDRKPGTQTGVIAQEVATVDAALVEETTFAPDPDDKSRDFEGDVKIVKYGDINMRLLKAVQELSAELDAAKARIKTLEDA